MPPTLAVGEEATDEYMEGGAAVGAEESGSDDRVTITAMASTVVEKADLLATYLLIRDPFRVLEKPLLTLHNVLKWFTALTRREGRVGMASHCHGVVEIEAEEEDGAPAALGVCDMMKELLAEVRAFR